MTPLNITVLDAATLGTDIDLSILNSLGNISVFSLTSPTEIFERLLGQQVCIINKIKLSREILVQLPSLRLICVAATGYDNIDIEACRDLGIAVCNVAGYSANSVSQVTLAMVLSASVHLSTYRNHVVNGTYTSGGVQNILTPVYHELEGQTWGIIGYGNIGKKVGAVAKALGCRVLTVTSKNRETLKDVLRQSDILSVHVPLTELTRGMIGRDELAFMKPGAIIVNVARGAVLDEEAVAESIESGHLGYLGCDVYSTEPLSEDHPFYRIRNRENVCLTPHMAWGAYEARQRCMQEIYENIRAFQCNQSRNRIV